MFKSQISTWASAQVEGWVPQEFYRVWHFIVTLTPDIWGKSMLPAFFPLVIFYDEDFCTHVLNVIVWSIHDVGKVWFSVKTESERKKKRPRPAGFTCRPLTFLYVCVYVCEGRVHPSVLIHSSWFLSLALPPCFSPHIITILLLLHPLVTRSCTHSLSNPLIRLQRASRFHGQSGHTHTHTFHMWIATHSHRGACCLVNMLIFCKMLPLEGSRVSLRVNY